MLNDEIGGIYSLKIKNDKIVGTTMLIQIMQTYKQIK